MDPAAWRTVANRLARSTSVLLALDFDGTLAPIVEHPDKAALPGSTAVLLKELAQKPGFRIAIVTGRALEDVKRKAKRVVWICTEPRTSWGFGDSEMNNYSRACHQVVTVQTLSDLEKVAGQLVPT